MYEKFLEKFRADLPLEESFDVLERGLKIAGRKGVMYFIDGLTDGEKMQRVLDYLMKLPENSAEGISSSEDFVAELLPFLDLNTEESCEKAETKLYAGLVLFIVEGLDKIIIMDVRDYPSRSVEEPEKEKSLRGAKDGFTESIMDNIGLIRRRLRDNNLIFKHYEIGSISKSDVVITYMKDKASPVLVEKLDEHMKMLEGDHRTQTLTVGDQSLLEDLLKTFNGYSRINPFPKVRYSQRPDIIAAHLAEGKLAIISDNSPTVMLLPVGIFDFLQDVDDYYFPQITGNYFRMLRLVNFIVILFLTPAYLLIVGNDNLAPEILNFFIPEDSFAIPVFWQFILLEIAVDGLKLASLNTPESLGMSLSVIGALILGDFSIDSGWFISQTILCMAVVALAGFTQPSIELGYGVKFSRVLMLIGAQVLGLGGLIAGGLIALIVLASTRTLSGDSYLYPLIPFNGRTLKRLIFRTQK